MELEQQREYQRLHDEVLFKLRHHAFVDDSKARHVFQYLIIPSFTPPISWDVFTRRRRGYPDDFVLVRSSWRCDLDWEKLRTPVERLRHPHPFVPTIEVHQLNAEEHQLEILSKQLSSLKLTIGAPSGMSIDGVFYEVAIRQPPLYLALNATCRFCWWCEPPGEWDGLTAWVQLAESVFDSAWTHRGNAAPIPLRIKAIDDVAGRHEAQRLFHAREFVRTAELLADIGSRESLTPTESRMLELSLKYSGHQGKCRE